MGASDSSREINKTGDEAAPEESSAILKPVLHINGRPKTMVRRDVAVTVLLLWNYDFNAVRDQYDGLFLTNGPGDPMDCMEATLKLRRTIEELNLACL